MHLYPAAPPAPGNPWKTACPHSQKPEGGPRVSPPPADPDPLLFSATSSPAPSEGSTPAPEDPAPESDPSGQSSAASVQPTDAETATPPTEAPSPAAPPSEPAEQPAAQASPVSPSASNDFEPSVEDYKARVCMGVCAWACLHGLCGACSPACEGAPLPAEQVGTRGCVCPEGCVDFDEEAHPTQLDHT